MIPRVQIALVIAVAVLLAATGCRVSPPTLQAATPADTPQSPAAPLTPASPASVEPPGTPGIGAYPGPTMTAHFGYPGPAEAMNQEPPVTDYTPQAPTAPAPTERQGVVTGTLTRDIRGMPLQPIAETTLYLAEILRDTSGKLSGLASLDEETAPTTVTDAEGRFAFTEVEPGLYILIVKTPVALVPVRSAGEDVAAEVSAGKVTELGIIHSTVVW